MFSDKWGEGFQGISDVGALFTYSENGGRKLNINDEITIEQEYLYLCTNENFLFTLSDIEHHILGEVLLKSNEGSSVYKAYKLIFRVSSDKQFLRLYNFCREYLKVSVQ